MLLDEERGRSKSDITLSVTSIVLPWQQKSTNRWRQPRSVCSIWSWINNGFYLGLVKICTHCVTLGLLIQSAGKDFWGLLSVLHLFKHTLIKLKHDFTSHDFTSHPIASQ